MSGPKKQEDNSEPKAGAELYEILWDLHNHIDKADELVKHLEGVSEGSKSRDFCKAYVIKLFQEYIDDEDAKELMLAVCNLLNGFNNKNLDDRMQAYRGYIGRYNSLIKESWSTSTYSTNYRNLLKTIIHNLEPKLESKKKQNNGKLGLIDDVPKEFELPTPRSIPDGSHNIQESAQTEEVVTDAPNSKFLTNADNSISTSQNSILQAETLEANEEENKTGESLGNIHGNSDSHKQEIDNLDSSEYSTTRIEIVEDEKQASKGDGNGNTYSNSLKITNDEIIGCKIIQNDPPSITPKDGTALAENPNVPLNDFGEGYGSHTKKAEDNKEKSSSKEWFILVVIVVILAALYFLYQVYINFKKTQTDKYLLYDNFKEDFYDTAETNAKITEIFVKKEDTKLSLSPGKIEIISVAITPHGADINNLKCDNNNPLAVKAGLNQNYLTITASNEWHEDDNHAATITLKGGIANPVDINIVVDPPRPTDNFREETVTENSVNPNDGNGEYKQSLQKRWIYE